jgi:hypothetical protein
MARWCCGNGGWASWLRIASAAARMASSSASGGMPNQA